MAPPMAPPSMAKPGRGSSAAPPGQSALPGHAAHTPACVAPSAALYVSAPHSVHACAPGAVLYAPAAHAAHVPPFAPVNPALHSHAVAATCSESACQEFAGHALHCAEPVAVLNCPAPHAAHAPPFAPVNPALHSHAVAALCPVNACQEFAGHALHCAEPTSVLNSPAPHAAHAPPFAPVNPALHSHAVAALCPVDVCPEFRGQNVHAAAPGSALYFPAMHAWHVPPLSPVYPASHTHAVTAL